MRTALVNTNRIKPPIAPIGLDYTAEALHAAGQEFEVLDLCWPDDWESAIAEFFSKTSFDLVGLTLRNTDDCAFTSRKSFLGDFAAMVSTIRRQTDAVIILGGAGFSTMPVQVLDLCEADAGVWGDGEFSMVNIARNIERNEGWNDLDGLVMRQKDGWRINPPAARPLSDLPRMSRGWFDNRRYFREGGQAGFETKRGCPGLCIYCADPVAKGRTIRLRPPVAVVDEMENLLDQGIDYFHTCDSEFNLHEQHASEICEEIIRRRLAGKFRWYAYCSPVPFSRKLAARMRNAGCVGINFGVDSGDEEMLVKLNRDFGPDDILNAAGVCREEKMAVMLDLLLGCPGESRESITHTVDLAKRSGADRIGVSTGVRVYPGTTLEKMIKKDKLERGLVMQDPDPAEPVFYLDPDVASFAFDLLDELVGGDTRFLFFDPSKPDRNYNYNANQRLVEAIGKGYRGAYWDILRRYI